MAIIKLPKDVSGNGRVYPYLARLLPRFKDFTSIILLVEKRKQTVLFGKYTGDRGDMGRRYSIGSTFQGLSYIRKDYLKPFNKGQ